MIISNLTKQIITSVKLRSYPIWAPSAIFLSTLFILPNNKLMGFAIAIVLLFTLPKTRTVIEALFYTMILCLPFTKGKGFQFPLLSADQTGYNIPYTFDFDLTFWNALLLFVLYMILRNRTRLKTKFMDTSDTLLLFFVLSLIPSTLLSRYPEISLLGFTEVLFMILLYFVTKLLASHINSHVVSIIFSLQLIFEGAWSTIQFILKRPIGNAIEGFGGLLTQSNFIEYAIEQKGFFRSRGTFDHSNTLGSFAASLVPFVAIILLYGKNSSTEKALYTAALIGGIMGIIVSGSRTSLFILLIFLARIFILTKKDKRPHINLGRITNLTLLGIFLVALPTIIVPRILQFYTTLQGGGGLTYRLNLISYASQIAQQNIFGVGLGMYPKVVFNDIGTFASYPAQPHNLFAQLAAEAGYISLSLFILFLLRTATPRLKRANPYGLATTASLGVILLVSQIYPSLLRSTIFPYFWVFLAMRSWNDYNNIDGKNRAFSSQKNKTTNTP